ncbi:MAG: outer membrane protein assembly factor BamA [Acidobacteriota bacterium]
MRNWARKGGEPLFLFVSACLLVAWSAGRVVAQQQPEETFQAARPRIVDVRVEGNRRLSDAAFFRLTTLRTGQDYDLQATRRQFRLIWDSGLFDDLWVETVDAPGGKVVVFHVVERPVVVSVTFEKTPVIGLSAIEDRLKERDLSIKLNEPINRERIRAVEEEVKRMHEQKGFLGTVVHAEITPLPNNGQSLEFKIRPGAKTLIKKIQFTGNHLFSNRALKHMMPHTIESGFRGFFSKKDLYHPVGFAQDLESVRTNYLDKGHLDIQIKAPVVDFIEKKGRASRKEQARLKALEEPELVELPPPPGETPKEKKKREARQKELKKKAAKAREKAQKKLPPPRKAKIVVPLDEGPEYKVGEITVTGNTVFPSEALVALIPMQRNTTFRSEVLSMALDRIEALYGQRGYFYASTNREISRREGNIADVSVVINEGKQYRLDRVEFTGNSTTRDRVLRRELRLREGDVFNTNLWQVGLTRVNQLGYFALSEEPKIVPVAGEGRLRATIAGSEQGRNEIQVGGGFSGVEGAFFQGSYATRNFLGRGDILQSSLQVGGRSQLLSLSFTEPYFLGTPNTVGGSLFTRELEFSDFTRNSSGFSLLYGRRLGNFSSYGITYRNERFDETGIGAFFLDVNTLPPEFEGLDALDLFQGGFGTPIPDGVRTTNSTLIPVFTFNTVNNPFRPSRGIRLRASLELTGDFLGGDNDFIKPIVQFTWYHPAIPRTFLAVHVEAGLVEGIGTSLIPRSERFFLGGDTRGPRVFQTRSLSPIGPVAGIAPLADNEGNILGIPFAVVGGDSFFLSQNELVFQVSDPFDLALFLDAGNAFDDDASGFDLGDLRFSAGLEARFHLPVFQAPIRLIFGRVLDERDGDLTNSFQFSIGFPF